MIKKMNVLLAVLAVLVTGAMTRAQQAPTNEYVLAPDDVVEIVVRNHDSLNKTATISPDGTIALPEVGEVKAAGVTAKKLASTIQAELDKTLNNAFVTVTLKESHPAKLMVRVLGAAKTVGMVEIKPNWRVIDLIAAAGGITAKPTLVTGRVVRGTDVIAVDVPGAFAHPEGDANIRLQAGDLILFDEKEVPKIPQISVVGQVEKPGTFDLDETTSLSSIMTQTGGATQKAALAKAYILRKGQRVPVDLRRAAAGDTSAAGGIKFEPGDILFVPESTEKYAVLGEAHSTGSFVYPSTGKITVLEAYTQVGGSTANGDLANAGIIRFTNGQYNVAPVNLALLLQKKGKEVNPTLEPGDTLYIPTRKSRGGFSWQNVLSPLTALGLLGLRL